MARVNQRHISKGFKTGPSGQEIKVIRQDQRLDAYSFAGGNHFDEIAHSIPRCRDDHLIHEVLLKHATNVVNRPDAWHCRARRIITFVTEIAYDTVTEPRLGLQGLEEATRRCTPAHDEEKSLIQPSAAQAAQHGAHDDPLSHHEPEVDANKERDDVSRKLLHLREIEGSHEDNRPEDDALRYAVRLVEQALRAHRFVEPRYTVCKHEYDHGDEKRPSIIEEWEMAGVRNPPRIKLEPPCE